MILASVIELPPIFHGIEAVCFDAYGMLAEITEKRGAVRQFFEAVRRALHDLPDVVVFCYEVGAIKPPPALI